MKETVAGERPSAAAFSLPPEVASQLSQLAASVVARTQIVWGEHCSECGYPACFSSCAFYAPRSDLACRRFVAGIEQIWSGPQGTAPFRIRFRKWGKLEGPGPATLIKASAATTLEQIDRAAGALLTAAPLPFAIRRRVTRRWNWLKGQAQTQGEPIDSNTAFVIEAWSVDGKVHPFTLSIVPPPSTQGGMFQEHFEVAPSYGRTVIPVARILEHVDLTKPYLVQIEPVGEAAGRDVLFGLCDFASFDGALPPSVAAPKKAKAEKAEKKDKALEPDRKAKVVVWDLDETLWHGTLAETGPDGVTLRPETVEVVKALDERGIIQSIASKNDLSEALVALKRFGIDHLFLYPQVGWGPKSDSMRRIAANLDLGIDSFVFVDDQPFERNEVLAAHPTMRVLPHDALPGLHEHKWFAGPVTAESRARRSMYEAEIGRVKAYEASGTDYVAFLRASNLELDLRTLVPPDAERTHELSQRTNQLNFTGARLTRDDVAKLMEPKEGRSCVTMRCSDRFGDYGLIGFAVVDAQSGWIEEFFMSCRVQRKRVEPAFFAWVNRLLAPYGHETVRCRFKKTARNSTAHTMLTELGFKQKDEAGTVSYERELAPYPDEDVVKVKVT